MSARDRLFIRPSDVPMLAGLGAGAALCLAFLAQYGFGLAPCQLCYWQRYGYGIAIGVSLLAIFTDKNSKARQRMTLFLALAFLGVALIALFHAGIEYKWWQGFTSCTGSLAPGQSNEDLLEAITKAPIVRCDEPAFLLFGISMAGYNFFYALGLCLFSLWGARKGKA